MATGPTRVLIEAARAARRHPPLAAPLFINLWCRRHGGAQSWHPDAFTDLDEAAADAAQPSLYAYAGTLMVTGGRGRLLDLSAHGARLLAEARRERADERRHRRGLAAGAGRNVL